MLSKTLVKYSGIFLRNPDKDDIRVFLESSPQYPNLLSVMQTLRYAGLDVQAGQCDWGYLRKLVAPFLLHLKAGNKQNLVIAKWDSRQDCLRIFGLKNKRWEIRPREDVAEIWDGVVIYTTDRQINRHSRTFLGIMLSVILCITLIFLFKTGSRDIGLMYYGPLLSGIVASCCLYLKSEKMEGGIIDRLCHVSKVADCDRVDDSKYSSIFGFKMNCLALSFFTSQAICAGLGLMFGFENILYSLYLTSAVVFIPVMAYSGYGQFKVKNICPLCVIVVLCIAIEVVMFISWTRRPINIRIAALFCGVFSVATAILQYISNINHREAMHLAEGIKFLKLKRKKEIILTESTPAIPVGSPIGFGDETSPSNVTTIISPGCSHCRKVVSEVMTLLKKGVRFRWNIILGQTAQHESGIIDNWIRRFMTDKKKFFEDLDLWSNGAAQMSPPISQPSVDNTDISKIRQSFDYQIAELNISGFPQIILNDRLLSPIYTARDLEFLITDETIIQ